MRSNHPGLNALRAMNQLFRINSAAKLQNYSEPTKLFLIRDVLLQLFVNIVIVVEREEGIG
jgi:hypothetical protein